MEIIKLILMFLSTIFMSYGFIKAFSSFTRTKIIINKRNKIIIPICCIIILINNYYNISSLRILISFIITNIIEKLLFNKGFKETFIYTTIITIISLIIELVIFPIVIFINPNVNSLTDNYLPLKIILSALETLILIYLCNNNKIQDIVNKIVFSIKKFINFYTLSLGSVFVLNLLGYFLFNDLKNISLLIIALITIIFLIICSKVIINDKYNLKFLTEKNIELTNSKKAYSITLDECREFKHNLKNDLYSLKTKLPKEHQDILNKIIIKYNKESEWITIIDEIPEGLQGLFYLKQKEAKNKKVKMLINTHKEIKTNNKDYLDLCNVIGILLDNAIEASSRTRSKIIDINIIEEKNDLKIKIINKYLNKIDLEKIGTKNYSTKEYKSGLGLNYIKKLKKQNLQVKFNIINDLFITTVNYKQK